MSESHLSRGAPPSPEGMAHLHNLMTDIGAGSEAALEQLIRLLWTPLVRYVCGQLHDLDAARDVVQQVFIQVWQRRADWTPAGSPRSYLYRIAHNLLIDEQRKRGVRKRWILLGHKLGRESATPLQIAESDELRIAYERAMAALPDRRREVFTLVHLRGLSHQEVATVMGISPQTVANQMSAALASLRRALAPFIDAGDGPR